MATKFLIICLIKHEMKPAWLTLHAGISPFGGNSLLCNLIVFDPKINTFAKIVESKKSMYLAIKNLMFVF